MPSNATRPPGSPHPASPARAAPRRPRRRPAAADRHIPGAGRTCRAPCAAPRAVCPPTARRTRPAHRAGPRRRAPRCRAGGRCGPRPWCTYDQCRRVGGHEICAAVVGDGRAEVPSRTCRGPRRRPPCSRRYVWCCSGALPPGAAPPSSCCMRVRADPPGRAAIARSPAHHQSTLGMFARTCSPGQRPVAAGPGHRRGRQCDAEPARWASAGGHVRRVAFAVPVRLTPADGLRRSDRRPHVGRAPTRALLPMTDTQIAAVAHAAVTPAERLVIALVRVHDHAVATHPPPAWDVTHGDSPKRSST